MTSAGRCCPCSGGRGGERWGEGAVIMEIKDINDYTANPHSLEPDEGAAISCSSSSLHTLMLDNKHISDLVVDEGEVFVGYPGGHNS